MVNQTERNRRVKITLDSFVPISTRKKKSVGKLLQFSLVFFLAASVKRISYVVLLGRFRQSNRRTYIETRTTFESYKMTVNHARLSNVRRQSTIGIGISKRRYIL